MPENPVLSLPDIQRTMARALVDGPGHVPLDAFAGSPERVLIGFKVHANTISHGRLCALEDTFPRLRDAIGASRFNRLSRRFLEAGEGAGEPLDSIGRSFPDHLAARRVAAALVALARVEWAWLEAWKAADEPGLRLSDLAGLTETELLARLVRRHPAARLVSIRPRTRMILGLQRCAAALVTRPEDHVLITGADCDLVTLFAALEQPQTLGDLLSLSLNNPLGTLHRALDAGLLASTGD